MNTIINKSKAMRILVIWMLCIMNFTSFSQSEDKIITVKSIEPNQYHSIQYQSIDINQNVDFSNLIRVYINKASIVMVDNKVVEFEKTGGIIKNLLLSNVKSKYGQLTIDNINESSCNLKLLIRKSIFTNKDDFKALMLMVDNTIWDLLKYYSNMVYEKEYSDLSTNQKNNINNLVPLHNFLAKDNTD